MPCRLADHCTCRPPETAYDIVRCANWWAPRDPPDIWDRAAQEAEIRSDIWDHRFIGLAAYIANEWSKDPSTKVGAVLVDPDTRTILGTGYNGFPRGVRDDPERLADRAQKYPRIVHAEVNAILTASQSPRGATIYTSPFAPCNECAKTIIQAGIRRVVAPAVKIDRWSESNAIAAEMFSEAGVQMDMIEGI